MIQANADLNEETPDAILGQVLVFGIILKRA